MHSIHHDLIINSDPKTIMDMITTPTGFCNWWTLKCTGELKEGGTFNFYFDENYNWSAEVINYKALERISFCMTLADADWEGTKLHFMLIPKDREHSYLLRFDHTGWKEINDHFRRSSYCWALYLQNLKVYVERGVETTMEERRDG